MIEHEPYLGPEHEQGIRGQKVVIVGYSHHRKIQDDDHDGFTNVVMQQVLSGQQRGDALFSKVAHYFGFEDRTEFWKKVIFFNFVPECVGQDKYATASPALHRRGRERFERILRTHQPSKAFVFTSKGWANCPRTFEEEMDEVCPILGHSFEDIAVGRYKFGAHVVKAFGLRHPQYAKSGHMKEAIRLAMDVA